MNLIELILIQRGLVSSLGRSREGPKEEAMVNNLGWDWLRKLIAPRAHGIMGKKIGNKRRALGRLAWALWLPDWLALALGLSSLRIPG